MYVCLAVVFFFIGMSESKRLPGSDFMVKNMKENIRAIFVYVAANFESNSGKMFEILNTN